MQTLRALARETEGIERFCFDFQLERGVLPDEVQDALIAVYQADSPKLRYGRTHALATAEDLRTILRSLVVIPETQAAVLASAHWLFQRLVAAGQAPDDDPRLVLKSWRHALAWAADRHSVWCPGAARVEKSRLARVWRGEHVASLT